MNSKRLKQSDPRSFAQKLTSPLSQIITFTILKEFISILRRVMEDLRQVSRMKVEMSSDEVMIQRYRRHQTSGLRK